MMPMQVVWENKERDIIRVTSHGHWTWDEYYDALDDVVKLAKSVEHRVDLMMVKASDAVTPKSSGMPHYQHATRVMPANVYLHVLVSSSRMASMVLNIFLKIFNVGANTEFVIAASVPAATALIQQHRDRERPGS